MLKFSELTLKEVWRLEFWRNFNHEHAVMEPINWRLKFWQTVFNLPKFYSTK